MVLAAALGNVALLLFAIALRACAIKFGVGPKKMPVIGPHKFFSVTTLIRALLPHSQRVQWLFRADFS